MQSRRIEASLSSAVQFRTFDDLFSQEAGIRLESARLLSVLFGSGRTLLQGSTGSGRSTTLRETAARIMLPDASFVERIPNLRARGHLEPHLLLDWMLSHVEAAEVRRFLLCLDGLDEVPLVDAQVILDVSELASQQDPRLSILISDGLTRRSLQDGRWALLRLTQIPDSRRPDVPLPELLGGASVGGNKRLVSTLRSVADRLSDGRATSQLEAVARGAYEWLRDEQSTSAPVAAVARYFEEDLLTVLIGRGLLEESNGVVRFAHQLLHSYFAANAASLDEQLRSDEGWTILTLDRANFTALNLLVEIAEPEYVDAITRSVDSWSYQAAAMLLADSAGRERISAGLRAALQLLLGYRRFASSPSTSVISTDLLRLQSDPLATRVLRATSLDDLVRIANGEQIDGEWWSTWISVFRGDDTDLDMQRLRGEDNVIAWTAANVLAATQLDESSESVLADVMRTDESAAVRWRAAHALGGSRSASIASQCLQAFGSDDDEWVQYGALRSFFGIVLNLDDRAAREVLLSALAERNTTVVANDRWEREIERAASLVDVPSDWAESFGPVVESMWAVARSVEEEDRWRSTSAALRTRWKVGNPADFRPVTGE